MPVNIAAFATRSQDYSLIKDYILEINLTKCEKVFTYDGLIL